LLVIPTLVQHSTANSQPAERRPATPPSRRSRISPMRKAHRWPLASSAASLVVLAFAASAAAQSNNEAVNACRQIADAEARITCLEAALMARDTAPAITAPEPAPSTSATSIPAATEQDAENDTGRGWIRKIGRASCRERV